MSHINVTINGRQYRMACEEGQEVRLLKLAESLETRVGEARVTVARVAPETQITAGDQVRLSVQAGRLHFFDPETEAAIAA